MLVGRVDVGFVLLDGLLCLGRLLVLQFHLEALELYFLAEHVILAVVLHIVELRFVACNGGLGLLDFALAHFDVLLQGGNLLLVLADAVRHALDVVLQVLHLERQFAAQNFDAVNLRQHRLQLVEVLQLLFHGHVRDVFFSHII